MDVLFTLKLMIKSQNFQHRCIKYEQPYSIPVKNSFSEISLFAHHPATFLTQLGICVSSCAKEFGISMLDPIIENNIINTTEYRI